MRRIFAWAQLNQYKILFGAIFGFTLFISWLCFAKYARLGYNAIDLAYFNQVFWNTVHGRPFFQTIHPHLSLGDHAEFAILLLAPFYALFQDPRTLLFLQTLALALGAWPVYLLARDRFGRASLTPLLFGLLWLANPFLQNIALFEFHILPFALTPLLFALLAYRRDQKKSFLFWSVLALLCREDVALVVMTVALLAFLEKKSRWWKIVPLILGAVWFVAAMKIIGYFAPGDAYKFNVYYQWLGNSLPQVFVGVTKHPMLVLRHITTVPNAEMFLGFFMPYLFLPLLAPMSLVLALGPLAQILLGAPGGGELVLNMHYATLFLPALTLATIEGFVLFPAALLRLSKKITKKEGEIGAVVCLTIGAIYSALVLGPLPTAFFRAFASNDHSAQTLLAHIPKNAPVAASYALMPILSSREHFYAAHYLFLGVTQFALSEYPPPKDLRYTLFDLHDLLIYRAQFPNDSWTTPYYASGAGRLEAAIGAPIAREGRFILFDREARAPLVAVQEPTPLLFPERFENVLLVGEVYSFEKKDFKLTLQWTVPAGARTDDLDLRIEIKNRKNNIVRTTVAAFNGLTPASLRRNDTVLTNIDIPLADLPAGNYVSTLTLERRDNILVLDADRSLKLHTKKLTELGSVVLTSFTLP